MSDRARRAAGRCRAGALLLLLAGCSSGLVKPAAPVQLAYGGRAGESRTWKLEQVLRGEFAFNGMPQLLVITLRGTLTEGIDEVTPEGWRRVTQTWAFDPVEFNGMPVPLEGIPRAVTGHTMRGPTGQTQALEEHADAAGDLLAWAARWIGGYGPLLADHAVLAGEPWDRQEIMPALGGSEFQLVSRGTLTGMEGRMARIATEGEITMTHSATGVSAGTTASATAPAESGASRTASGMESFHLQNSGEVQFDAGGGYVKASRQDGSLQFKGRTGKSPLTIRARFTSSFTEVP